jgi:hypothetical protein
MSVFEAPRASGLAHAGSPYPFDLRTLNRILGRGGRIADTPDPMRYTAVFRRVLRQFGDRLRYGFMLPVNLLLEGVVDHAIYHEPGVPQLAALTLFREQGGLWRVQAVLVVSGLSGMADELSEKLAALYGDFGVELLALTVGTIGSGDDFTLLTANFGKQAIGADVVLTAANLSSLDSANTTLAQSISNQSSGHTTKSLLATNVAAPSVTVKTTQSRARRHAH